MLKDKFPKMKEAICKISIKVADITKVSARSAGCNDLIVVKLKR